MAETFLWHPFAAMGEVRREELIIDRGQDVWVWDVQGRRFLDGTASLWYANVGHGRREIAEAIARQLSSIETYSTFGDFANRPALELAERLSALAPLEEARVFLTSGGGDAIDTAAKLARRYWSANGEPERVNLLSRAGGYHGTHGHGTSIGGIRANREGFGPLDEVHAVQVARDSVDALRAEIERLDPSTVAAFFVEPVIGAGGVYPPPPGYIEDVSELCRELGILLVVDSVICGFGRLGTWFGIERWASRPDMICFAKGVTSGYLPLGGVIASGRVSTPFWERPDAPVFRHGPTYAGHATCCAAALANIEILDSGRLLGRGRAMEGDLMKALKPLAAHPLVDEVRGGLGTLAAVELDANLLERHPAAVIEVAKGARRRGVLVRPLGACIAASPPLTANREHFGMIAEAIAGGLDDLARVAGHQAQGKVRAGMSK